MSLPENVQYEPYTGPSADLVRRTLARFPGRTAKDLASLSGVSQGHVYCVLASEVRLGRARREKAAGLYHYWPVETVVLERPLQIGQDFYPTETETREVPRDWTVGL